jgi:acyl-coenzyme A synthetase/AMP-(fatty) acid ligase
MQSATFQWEPTMEDDPCLVYFTSGTTGHPKMVLHNQSYPFAHQITADYWLDLGPQDLHWNVSDTGWAKAAWSSLFGPWMAGSGIVVDPMTGKFLATDLLGILDSHPITSLCAPPTVYRLLVQEDLTPLRSSSLRSLVGAGEPLNPEVIDAVREMTGLTIRDGYGQTETVVLIANPPGLAVKPGSMGKPAPIFEMAVIDPEGHPLSANQEGDIAIKVNPIRPPGLFVEYLGDPEGTLSRFVGDYYLTGDRAYLDLDGYFWFVGRADDVIISSGYRIGPFEVESLLIEHPLVVEAAVVSSPDPIRGEVVKAFVVLKPGVTGDDQLVLALQNHIKAATAPYKYPRRIEFVPELPKTISGKIRRIVLRQKEWAR